MEQEENKRRNSEQKPEYGKRMGREVRRRGGTNKPRKGLRDDREQWSVSFPINKTSLIVLLGSKY